MQYVRLFTGHDEQSHFETLPLTLLPTQYGKISEPVALSHVQFGCIEDREEVSWHNPPRKQYIIMLKGSMEIEIGSGERMLFHEGDLLLAEDTTGQGHITRAASEGPREYMVLPLSD